MKLKPVHCLIALWIAVAFIPLSVEAYSGGGEICNNGIDDDGDELTDCEDPDCTGGDLFPIIEDFNGGVLNDPNWVLQGSAQLNTDWLRLTDDVSGQAGNATLNTAFSSASNIIVEFEYATVNYNGDNCTFGIGDGLAFFLINGNASPSLGVSGAALGYSHGRTGDPTRGIDGGFIAVGLDEFGNFAGGNAAPSICTQLGSDAVTIRGEETSNDLTAYRCLSTTLLPGGADIDVASRDEARKVRIVLSPGGVLDVYLDLNDGNGLTPIFTDLVTGQTVPSTFKLGFSSSTGGACIAHEIDNLVVGKPADVQVSISGEPTVNVCDGEISWTVTAYNNGPNPANGVFLNGSIDGDVSGLTWDCPDCVTASGSGDNTFSAGLDLDVDETVELTLTANFDVSAAGSEITLSSWIDFACSGLISSNIDNSMDAFEVSVEDQEISVDLGPDVNVCDQTVGLMDAVIKGASYVWQDGSTEPAFEALESGTYWVEVSLGQCNDRDTVEVTIDYSPEVSIVGESTFCEPGSVLLTANVTGSESGLLWSTGETSGSIEVSEGGEYSVTAENGCGIANDAITVVSEPCECDYFIPNAFSPNKDGLNDEFSVQQIENVDALHIEVFDRWGEQVFESNDPAFSWDGRFRGRTLPTDVYYYFAEISCAADGLVRTVKGNITLIR